MTASQITSVVSNVSQVSTMPSRISKVKTGPVKAVLNDILNMCDKELTRNKAFRYLPGRSNSSEITSNYQLLEILSEDKDLPYRDRIRGLLANYEQALNGIDTAQSYRAVKSIGTQLPA